MGQCTVKKVRYETRSLSHQMYHETKVRDHLTSILMWAKEHHTGIAAIDVSRIITHDCRTIRSRCCCSATAAEDTPHHLAHHCRGAVKSSNGRKEAGKTLGCYPSA
jgi:hypothetical protein